MIIECLQSVLSIAALHDADDAIVLGSGVAALHALFWTLLESGDRVVYPNVSYMAVYRMFHELFNKKFQVDTVMVDMTDPDAVKRAITPGTRLVHIETPDNPTNGITDIAAIAEIAHQVSLGHDESLIFPQPSYDERIHLYPEKFRKGFIRFSVGLEDPRDIIRDLDQALQAVGL